MCEINALFSHLQDIFISQNIFQTSFIQLFFCSVSTFPPPINPILFICLVSSSITFSMSSICGETPQETRSFHLYYLCSFLAAFLFLHLSPHHVISYLVIRWIPRGWYVRRQTWETFLISFINLSLPPSLYPSIPPVSLIGYLVIWGFPGGLLI